MAELLTEEIAFLLGNIEKLAKDYPGKYLLIKGSKVYGSFETRDEGIRVGATVFGEGPFLVRSVFQPEGMEAPKIPALSVGMPLTLVEGS